MLDLEEGLIASPQSSSQSVQAAEFTTNNDRQAALATQPQSPPATTASNNQTSISTPPLMTEISIENIELNNGLGSPATLQAEPPLEIHDDNHSKSSIPTTADTCETIHDSQATEILSNNADFGDEIQMTQSEISSSDSVIDIVPVQVEAEHEARLVTNRLGGGAVDEMDVAQIITATADSSINPAENYAADFLQFTEADGNVFLDFNTRDIYPHAIIHDAFLVEVPDDNDDVIIATHFEPTRPWWKQKRIQLVMGALLLFVAANAIAVVYLYSGKGNNEPSTTAVPPPYSADFSSFNSNHSSVSSHMLSQKACADEVSAKAQKLETGLGNPQHPRVAVDGSNMVMAVGDGDTTNSQVVIFFSLSNNGTWIEVVSFRMDKVGRGDAAVALSGQTAFVGFGEADNFAGVVFVFEQNQLGNWEQVIDPFIRTTMDESLYGFGLHNVAIDGDLACVVDCDDCVHGVFVETCYPNVNTFRRVGERWVEVDVIAGEHCRIEGNTLVVLSYETYSSNTWNLQLYEFNAAADSFVPYQDQIIVYEEVLSMELRNDYFVYWDRFQQGAVIYNRRNVTGPYSFVGQIFANAPSENQIALHNDLLIVGGDNQARIFTEDNGNWAEAITLNQRYEIYEYYQVSGRTLLATSETSVYSFNIEKCVQKMPTQPPS